MSFPVADLCRRLRSSNPVSTINHPSSLSGALMLKPCLALSSLSRTGGLSASYKTFKAFSTYTSITKADPSESALDRYLLTQLSTAYTTRSLAPPGSYLPECSYTQYRSKARTILTPVLPSEPYPSVSRRADHPVQARIDSDPIGDGLVLVVHATQSDTGIEYAVCSGFIIQAKGEKGRDEQFIVTCAHTLEEIEYRHPHLPKQTFIVIPTVLQFQSPFESNPKQAEPVFLPIPEISTSLPRTDLLICRLPPSAPVNLRSLPISPYPLSDNQDILVHCFGSPDPPIPRISTVVKDRTGLLDTGDGSHGEAVSWPNGLGWRRWVKGRMLGYRGELWREVEPGTADSLPFILTSPLPSPGSSGGPIIDAQTGAVVGVISGTRMDNRIEGERGWGASAENIFEVFSLAGFIPSSKRYKGV